MPTTTSVLSYLQNSEKIAPMLLIEVPTTLGRTYQGYKRGGETEGREKICEETLGAVVWLFGVKLFNKIGDFIGEKILGLKDLGVDVGKDSLRNPSAYITDKKALTAAFKFSKIAASAIMGTLAMGMVVPKIKMAMTNAFRMQDGLEPYPNNKKDGVEKYTPGLADKIVGHFIKHDETPDKNDSKLNENALLSMDKFVAGAKNSSVSFTGGGVAEALMYASHNLENNTAWRLLSTDAGTLAGRVANSRSKKEGIEYFVRDSISSLFYIFAAPLTSMLIRKATQTPDVHPKGAEAVSSHLKEILADKGGSVQNGFFTSGILSKEEQKELVKNINFKDNKTISLAEFNRQTSNKYLSKAGFMSELQPQYIMPDGVKTSILSERQAADIMSSSATSDPIFLKKAISDVTNGKSDDAKSFVSRKRLEKIRDSFDDYVINLEKYAKKKTSDGVINEELIDKFTKTLNRKNLLIHMAGLGAAVLGLAVLIPKFQYFVSEKLTGTKEFLGDSENSKTDK